MTNLIRLVFTAVISVSICLPAGADTVNLVGASTAVDLVFAPDRVAVERVTGHSLRVVDRGSRSLLDLSENRADAAIISEPLELAVAAAETAGIKVAVFNLRVHELRTEEIVFVVNAGNPVGKLSVVQLADIHTGKISNWKQVGGKDLGITLIADASAEGTNAIVKQVVMGGAGYASGAKSVNLASGMNELIAADESAIVAVGKGLLRLDRRLKVIETSRLERPLAIVTWGEPQPKVVDVINGFRAEGSRWLRRTAHLRPPAVSAPRETVFSAASTNP